MNLIRAGQRIKSMIEQLLYSRVQYARKLGVHIGEDCTLVDNPDWGADPFLITIGNHVLISGKVAFITHDGSTFVFRETDEYRDTFKFGQIIIGNNCFIGYRSILLLGITIGDNSIIGAGSLVTKNIPAGEVWGGVPARFISKTEDYARKCYENRLPYDPYNLKRNKKEEMLKTLKLKNES